MGFLFNLFLFFALLDGEGRLSLSQNTFSQFSETSVRCLDPNSGEEVTDEKIELGVSCIAEIKSEKGISYQYLHPKMSIDWDALNFNDVDKLLGIKEIGANAVLANKSGRFATNITAISSI